MSCEEIGPELIGYHFGTLAPEVRNAVEEHLPGCAACVRSFVSLKRDLESGTEQERPSPAARARLRRAVAAELRGPVSRPWRVWERPVAFGFAALVVAVAITALKALSPTM